MRIKVNTLLHPALSSFFKHHSLKLFFSASLLTIIYSCNKEFNARTEPQNNNASSALDATLGNMPNIVMIVGDDVGYEALSYNGGETFSTPHCDSLAQQGIRFTNVFSPPLTSPGRFMIFTGKYNFRNYVTWGVMDTSNRTIANMLRDAGYNTCFAGKWQLSGGDASIKALGFNKYSAFNVRSSGGGDFTSSATGVPASIGSQYKNPKIYQDAHFLPSTYTDGKYGDDIFAAYVNSFIDSNNAHKKPFFVYYAPPLCHSPYSPTPDDPEFAAWDPNVDTSNEKYFPSMVKYQDKKIGEVIAKIKSLGIENNTIIICLQGDNGTANRIKYYYQGKEFIGKKGKTNRYGTHVPMIINWTGKITPGVNNDLIDFTDFMPTLAGIANIPTPTTYGVLDGVSFYPRLFGLGGTPRSWIFTQTELQFYRPDVPFVQRYIFDTTYKLYDSTGKFYNISRDPNERNPLDTSNLTSKQRAKRDYFQSLMDGLH